MEFPIRETHCGHTCRNRRVVVFGSADHNIYGLDAVTGKERWRITVAQPVLGAVTIEKGIAYIGGSDSTFRAIRIKNGKVVWTYTGIKGYIETKLW